jgi:hypothetical protein
MFYKQEEVNSILLCSICWDTFQDNDPRLLPCGESACQRCIENASDANNQLNCLRCQSSHGPSSEEGFPPNLIAQRLTRTKAQEVYRNQNVEKLRSKLTEVKEKADDLKTNFENGTDEVKEYCIKLRNQVHLQTAILLQEAHKFNENMIAEVNNYEKKCVNSFKKDSARYKKESLTFLDNINKFYENNSNYLTQFKINDGKVKDGLTLADNRAIVDISQTIK